MSYAIHFGGLPREPAAFEATLRKMIAFNHAGRRADEQESVRRIRLMNMIGRGDAPPGLWEEYEVAVRAAKLAGDQYLKKEAKTNALEKMVEKATGDLKTTYAAAHAAAEGERAIAQSQCELHDKAATDALAIVKTCVTDEDVAHVPDLYDIQIERAVQAAIILLPGIGTRCKTVRVQIGGHVEEDPKGDGLVSVHLYPEIEKT